MVKLIAVLFLNLVLVGCQTVQAPVQNPREIWCASNAPVRLNPLEIKALETHNLRQFLAHNNKGALWCGWKK